MTRGRRSLPRVVPASHIPGEFSARLERVIKAYGSVTAMAVRIGRSEGTLRKWLSGKSEPTASDLRAICEVAGFSIEWLVSGRGSIFAAIDLVDFIAYTMSGEAIVRWREFSQDRREELREKATDVLRGWIEPELYVDGERRKL
jgi:transcriptional regulator with XRE-family HTH domain